MNTPFLYLHSFCVAGVSSGLANSDLASGVMAAVGTEYYTGLELLLISFL
jgi:hypothetical protein